MWGRLSSLATNPNLAQLSQLTKDGIGQLSKITNDVLAEVKAVEAAAIADEEGEDEREAADGGWFGQRDADRDDTAAAADDLRQHTNGHWQQQQQPPSDYEELKRDIEREAGAGSAVQRGVEAEHDKDAIELSHPQHDELSPPHTPIQRVSTPLQHRSDTPVSTETAAEQRKQSETDDSLLDVTFGEARERFFSTDSALHQQRPSGDSHSVSHDVSQSTPVRASASATSASSASATSYSSTFPLTGHLNTPQSEPSLSSLTVALQSQLDDERRGHADTTRALALLEQLCHEREAEVRSVHDTARVREEEWQMKASSMEEMVQQLEEERSKLVEEYEARLESERSRLESESQLLASVAAQTRENESIEQLRDEYERLQREMQAVRLDHTQAVQQLQLAHADRRHSDETQRETLTAVTAQLAARTQEAQRTSEQTEEERQAVRAEKASLEQQIADLQQQLQSASSSAPTPSTSNLPSPTSASTSASASPSPSSPPPNQSAMIKKLDATVEKLRRIIHRLTTERNDLLTVVQSVHNGVMAFAERNGINTSDDEHENSEQTDEPSKESEEDRRRKLQPLLDRVLAQVQSHIAQPLPAHQSQQQPPSTPVRLAAPIDLPATPSMPPSPHTPPLTPAPSSPPASSPSPLPASSPTSPSTASLQSQLASMRAAYESERAEKEKLRRLQEAMVQWKEKASQAMSRSKEERDKREQALLLRLKEVNDEWERRWQEVQASAQSEADRSRASDEERSQVDAQLHSLKDLLRASEEQCSALQQQVEALRREVNSSRTGQLKAADGEEGKAALRAELDELRRVLDSERAQSAGMIEQLRHALAHLESQHSAAMAALEKQTTEQQHTIAALQRDIAEEKERTEHGWDERDEQWKGREEEYMLERQEWQRQLDESSARMEEAREEVRLSKERDVAALEAKVRDVTRQLDDERKREKRERLLLEGRIRELIDERDRERAEREAEMVQAQQTGNSNQLEAVLQEKEAALDSLQQQYELLAAQHAEHDERLQTLTAEVEARREREDQKDTELSALHVRLADAEQSSDKLRVHLKEATATVRQQYEEALQDIERLTQSVQQYQQAEEQHKAVADLCEQLSYQLEQKDGECRANVDALNNLHSVLEAFQHEQEELKGRLEREVDEWKERADRGEQAAQEFAASQQSLSTLSAALSALQSQLLDSQNALSFSQQETASLRASIAANASRLQLFSSDTEYSIDRRLVVTMLLTYFEKGQKDDVMQLMYRVLGLTDDEKARIERARRGRGIGGRLYGLTSYLNPFDAAAGGTAASAVSVTDAASLADLWVDFLLKETEQQQTAREQAEKATAAATQPHSSAMTSRTADTADTPVAAADSSVPVKQTDGEELRAQPAEAPAADSSIASVQADPAATAAKSGLSPV